MTDRTRYLTVILDQDMRVDDVEEVVKAIRQNRWVGDVKVGPPPDHMAREEAKYELRRELYDFMKKLLSWP